MAFTKIRVELLEWIRGDTLCNGKADEKGLRKITGITPFGSSRSHDYRSRLIWKRFHVKSLWDADPMPMPVKLLPATEG